MLRAARAAESLGHWRLATLGARCCFSAQAGGDQPKWISATAEAYAEGCTTLVSKDGRKLLVDEPVKLGGKGIGANPLTFFLSGLLGCTQYTAYFIAKELKVPDLGRASWAASADFDMRGLRGLSDDYDARFQKLRVTGTFDTQASQEDLDRIADQVERRCIIAATLRASGMDMQLELRKGPVEKVEEPPFDS